ncbi:hypothetical protein [Pseudoalteromonas holothuriae]|nr:hypothetical protein [Pseudoalteromonas sp. CIP111854]
MNANKLINWTNFIVLLFAIPLRGQKPVQQNSAIIKALAVKEYKLRFIISITLLCTSFLSSACSCFSPSLEESVQNADFIYVGQIISAQVDDPKRVLNYLSNIETLKGSPDTDTLVSYIEEGMCSSPAAVGYRYVVFGKKGITPTLELCGATQMITESSKELVASVQEITANKSLKQEK